MRHHQQKTAMLTSADVLPVGYSLNSQTNEYLNDHSTNTSQDNEVNGGHLCSEPTLAHQSTTGLIFMSKRDICKRLLAFRTAFNQRNIRSFSSSPVIYRPRSQQLRESVRINSLGELSLSEGKVFWSSELDFKEMLGEGFFGRVTRVVSKRTGEVMVMKELKGIDKYNERYFINEIELLKRLKHYNLIRYIGVVLVNKRINVILG